MNASVSSPASLTSFAQLFGREINGHTIQEIEIPLIQRDYAQGRKTENVNRIRENFIDTLCKALMPGSVPIDLDFVFGDVEASGKFYPLDGQQRLTTLFLLHCYLAWRTGALCQDQSWTKFSYATRPGARDFCAFLVQCQPDFSETLSNWIKDQADYLPTWRHDPTIQSMLVVLDALHRRFAAKQSDVLQAAWNRLMDEEKPAIRFHVLPMKTNGLTDTLYIKMNSRGKPLTEFENFKAHFEEVLKKVYPAAQSSDVAQDFAQKVDTDWSDILWPYRGEDNLIDDEFMRYFRFITEVCAWKAGIEGFNATTRDDDLAEQVYSIKAPKAADSLAFLFKAFDVWKGKVVKVEFEDILASRSGGRSTPLLMFNPFDKEGVDLFHACCRHYGTRQWTLAHTLLLYAVLLKPIHQITETDFSKRLRILRNLVEASGDEIRAGERNNMPKLLDDVENIMVDGDLKKVGTFNQVQLRNELDKYAMLQTQTMPTLEASLHRLEDHNLLRGSLTAFDFDPTQFTQRAQAFVDVFNKSAYTIVTGALLAKGNYSRQENRWTGHCMADFGAPKNDDIWKELFRGKKREIIHPVLKPLMALLDTVAAGHSLQDVINAYITDPNTPKDWRYYFVKYDTMRIGASGRYTISPSGYQVCMLNKERMSSYYYDPYLLTMVKLSGITADKIANPDWPRCFSGFETDPRKLILKNSGLKIQCVDKGWEITEAPTEPTQKAIFDQICNAPGISPSHSSYLYSIRQINGVDTEDRVEKAALLLTDLIQKGL
jgi:hypothetical protein